MRAVEKFLEDSPFDAALWDEFARGLFYLAGDIAGDDVIPELATKLAASSRLPAHGRQRTVLPFDAAQLLRAAWRRDWACRVGRRADAGAWRRIVIEKPFGHDRRARAS